MKAVSPLAPGMASGLTGFHPDADPLIGGRGSAWWLISTGRSTGRW